MEPRRPLSAALAGLFLVLALVPAASAQNHALTARSFVQSPQALGMGDAGVAFGDKESAFFYNPAKLAHIGMIKPKINLIGVRTSISSNIFDHVNYYRDEVSPRVEAGLDSMTPEELQAFYADALEQGRNWASFNGDVLLPSVMMRVSMIGVGGGVFSETHTRYRIGDAGDGVTPALQLAFQSDQMAVVSGGMKIPAFVGLSVGLTGKYTYRIYGAGNEALPVFDVAFGEVVVPLMRGSSVGFDVGLLYEVPALPGELRLGMAVYDFIASDFDYDYSNLLLGTEENITPEHTAYFESLAAAFQPKPSMRLGAAYTLPTAWIPFLDDTGVALDYIGYRNPFIEDQSFWTKVHFGVQAELAILAMRAGLSQGLPTWGAGLNLGLLHFDYAYYPYEYGQHPGDMTVRNHSLQLRLGF